MREADWIVRAIALVQITGGAVGASMACVGFFGGAGASFAGLIIFAVFVWCFVAGILLFRQRPSGYRTSIAAQLLQIPRIATASFTWVLSSGCGAWAGFGSGGFLKDHGLYPRFELAWRTGFGYSTQGEPWHVAVNLFALAATAYLLWQRPKNVHAD